MSFGNEYITHLEVVVEQLQKLRSLLQAHVAQLNPEEILNEITAHMNRNAFITNPQSQFSIQTQLENMFYIQKPLLRGNRQAFYHFLEDQILNLRFRRYVQQHFIQPYSTTFKEGYCTALPMLVLEKMNRQIPYWPTDTETLANPMKLVQHFKKNAPWIVSETTSLNSILNILKRIQAEPGLLVVLDMSQNQGTPSQKNGQKHLLIYRGSHPQTQQPEFISFDQDQLHLTLTHRQCGYLINLPALLSNYPRLVKQYPLAKADFSKQRN